MSAAHVAVALASVSLAMSAAALVSCGTLAKKVRAQAPPSPPVPRLDLSTVRAGPGEAEAKDGEWAESVGECEDGEWEEWEKEGSDDDKENRPPDFDWYKDRRH